MTGATGMVGRPIAMELARTNEVWAVGRFGDASARSALEDAGVCTVQADLTDTDLSVLSALSDADFVLNFAVSRTNDWDVDLDVNVDGLGALMYACRNAKAVLHCSTTGVYQEDSHRRFAKGDPLGDNHRKLTGLEPKFVSTAHTLGSVTCDLTRMHESSRTAGMRDLNLKGGEEEEG